MKISKIHGTGRSEVSSGSECVGRGGYRERQQTTDGRSEWFGSESCMRIPEQYLTEGVNIRTAGKEIRKPVYMRFDVGGCERHGMLCNKGRGHRSCTVYCHPPRISAPHSS